MYPAMKKAIYLADLTHTGKGVASNVFPLAIGLLGSYLDKIFPGEYDVQLFKYPNDLNQALTKKTPVLCGFSNYSWNCDISFQFAKRIKKQHPGVVTVFGGPNYGLSDLETKNFWDRYESGIDFYIYREGEIAFANLVQRLKDVGFSADKLKENNPQLDNTHYRHHGQFISGPELPRIKDLNEIGSPYTKGMMDKFFDNVLIPMIHTTRGCPFSCTFCTEGNSYYSKVAQIPDLNVELRYIAEKRGQVQDLMITDANFGMYMPDLKKAEVIQQIQREFNWPKKILVSTGKNNKERIIEVASILNGALSIAASLQSTNSEVLKTIKRENISSEALNEIVSKAKKAESTTYTEIILGLPGDTKEAHIQSLKDVVDSGLGIIRMYQLILLPQTEMSTPTSRERFGFETKFRINPRSFGIYQLGGETFASVEHEEIVVSTSTLSLEDYKTCREIDFTIEFVHNTGLFKELQGLCVHYGLSWFDFIHQFFYLQSRNNPEIKRLYDEFAHDTLAGLWDSQDALEREAPEKIQELIDSQGGTNEMAKGKAVAFFNYVEPLHRLIYDSFYQYLAIHNHGSTATKKYLEQTEKISKLQKIDFLDTSKSYSLDLDFDLPGIAAQNFQVRPEDYMVPHKTVKISHSSEQVEMINSYVEQYGNNLDGLGRILMRAPLAKLFRSVHLQELR